MNHTPGPWKTIKPVNATHSWDYAIENDHEVFLKLNYLHGAYHPDGIQGWQNEARANAHLIAAAPELVEALKGYNLIDYTQLLGDALILNTDPRVAEILGKLAASIEQVRPMATQVIAKAEGKEG